MTEYNEKGEFTFLEQYLLENPERHIPSKKSKEKLEKTTAKQSRKGEVRKTPKIHKFIHPLHGEFIGSVKELIEAFPDLRTSSVGELVTGRFSQYKGWQILNGTEVPELRVRGPVPRVYHWTHSKYGEFTGTCKELVEAFPEQKIKLSCLLTCVKRGYKGWVQKGENK
jgi:hypothetical protein